MAFDFILRWWRAKLEGFRPKHNDDTLQLLEYANHASPNKINLGKKDLLEVINVDSDTPVTNTVIYLYKSNIDEKGLFKISSNYLKMFKGIRNVEWYFLSQLRVRLATKKIISKSNLVKNQTSLSYDKQ